MRALLDTSVLIALLDGNHIFHSRAQEWFARNEPEGWASCPITENGAARIMTRVGYRTRSEILPAAMLQALREFTQNTNHEFWTDGISIRESQLFLAERVQSASQITDTYLLALAIRNGGRLATLDSRISLNAVVGATPAHVVLIT